jgi:hypothetical protein
LLDQHLSNTPREQLLARVSPFFVRNDRVSEIVAKSGLERAASVFV